jgi:hypothetical protein
MFWILFSLQFDSGVARLPTEPIYEAYRRGNSDTSAAPDLLEVHTGPLTAYAILERAAVAEMHVAVHVGTHRRIAQLVQEEQQHEKAEPQKDARRQVDEDTEEGPDIWQDAAVQTSFMVAEEEADKEAETGEKLVEPQERKGYNA